MMKTAFFGALFVATVSTAQAQTFEQWLQRSQADYRRADNDLKSLIQNVDSAPCDIVRAKFNRDYANWYQQNAAQIQGMYNSFDDVVRYANGKIGDLRSMSFQPVVEKGQTKDPKVTFQTAVEYIRDLSARKKTAIAKGQLQVHQELVKDPEVSPFNLSLVQVVESLKNMSLQMNASLKERGVEFEIQFAEIADGYTLKLLITIQQSSKIVTIDLLSATAETGIGAQDRWSSLSSAKLGSYSIDAVLRYNEMREESASKQCLTHYNGKPVNEPYADIPEMIRQQLAKSIIPKITSGSRVVCRLGTTGKIEFIGNRAKILEWGGYSKAWVEEETQVTEAGRLEVRWGGTFGQIWLSDGDNGTIISSHGLVECRF